MIIKIPKRFRRGNYGKSPPYYRKRYKQVSVRTDSYSTLPALCAAVKKYKALRYKAEYFNKIYCRLAVAKAVWQGKIDKPKTCKCGSDIRIEAHHISYHAPLLDIIWLCRKCHCKAHGWKRDPFELGGKYNRRVEFA